MLARLLLLMVFAVGIVGCSTAPSSGPSMPEFDYQTAAVKGMTEYDRNRDGGLSKEEAQASPGLASAFTNFDKDGNGLISTEEFENRLKSYLNSGLALFGWSCEVRSDGVPLSGATITVVPEPFLGSAVQQASGTSDHLGVAYPMIDDKELQGARFGLYRVQVSKKDASGRELIPATYNERSTIGLELAADNRAAETRRLIEVVNR